MRVFQFSLWSLLAATAGLALFCVAVLQAGTLATAITLWLTLLSIPLAILGAVYRRASQRAFWLGYAAGAGFYAALVLYVISGLDAENLTRPALADHALISGEVAAWVHALLPEVRRPGLNRSYSGVSYAAQIPRAFRYKFHFAFIVLSGWMCGMAGAWLHRAKRESL